MMSKNGPLKYHGGKSYLSRWIQSHAPPTYTQNKKKGYTHRIHPYAGGLGELWSWMYEGVSETVNDLNGDLMNFYQVLKSASMFSLFVTETSLTPFGRPSFYRALTTEQEDMVGRAVAFFVRNRMSRQALGKDYATPTRRTRSGMHEHVSAYLGAVANLPEAHQRFWRVEVLCEPARDVICRYDHERAFFYLDPPYLVETRKSNGEYGDQEMSKAQHVSLLKLLSNLEGRFMLSGYPSSLYDQYAEKYDWRVETRKIDNKASGGKEKRIQTECIWMNY